MIADALESVSGFREKQVVDQMLVNRILGCITFNGRLCIGVLYLVNFTTVAVDIYDTLPGPLRILSSEAIPFFWVDIKTVCFGNG